MKIPLVSSRIGSYDGYVKYYVMTATSRHLWRRKRIFIALISNFEWIFWNICGPTAKCLMSIRTIRKKRNAVKQNWKRELNVRLTISYDRWKKLVIGIRRIAWIGFFICSLLHIRIYPGTIHAACRATVALSRVFFFHLHDADYFAFNTVRRKTAISPSHT